MRSETILFISIAIILVSNIAPISTVHAQIATIGVDPPSLEVAPGWAFEVAIKISDVIDMKGFEFNLLWDNHLMRAVSAYAVPPSEWGNNYFSIGPYIDNNYTPTSGKLYLGMATLGPVYFTGTHSVLYVSFQCLNMGESILDLSDTYLYRWDGPIDYIPHEVVDGHIIQKQMPPFPPTATFIHNPATSYVNETVVFDATTSLPGWNGSWWAPIVEYAWDFQTDGVIDAYGPEVTCIYRAIGDYTVTLKVTDSQGFWDIESTVVKVLPIPGVPEAIAKGIDWLVSQQNPDGSWGSNYYTRTAYTGLVLTKLQMLAYELGYESPFDPAYPYWLHVLLGWNFISQYASIQLLSLQDHTSGASGTIDNPDANGNGYGISFLGPEPTYQVYTTGICLMALQASGTPDIANFWGLDYDSDGAVDTFKEIAQDAADWLAMSQGDSGNDEGGWGYWVLDNQMWDDWTDNSNGGYATLGLAAAERFGCTIPDWVRTELNAWIITIQDPVNGDADDGGCFYNPDWGPWCNELKGGNLIFQMAFYGDDLNVQRVKDAIDYIERHWRDMNNDPGWGYGISPSNYQAMFCLMKGFEYSRIDLIDLDGDDIPEHDWYLEFAANLVRQQSEDGFWYMGGYGDAVIDTAWALLTLEKITPLPVIPVFVDIKPSSWPNFINIGSRGVFSVAICGTEDFDVTLVDPATVRMTLEGLETDVLPLRWSYEDVATPYTGEPGGGHTLGSDGYLDLVFHFDTQKVICQLGLSAYKNLIIPLVIEGSLYKEVGGAQVAGKDYVRVLAAPARVRGVFPI